MNEIKKLEGEIAILREKLNEELKKENGNHVPSEKILKISRELDKLVLKYQTFLLENKE